MIRPTKISQSTAADLTRFQRLWRQCLIENAADESASIYQQLIRAYNEPQRVYHTLGHIESCLTVFDQVQHTLKSPQAVELAIWFHDAVYQLRSQDNEKLSAEHFMALSNAVFNDPLRERVYQLILLTQHCGAETLDSDSKVMIDIDLFSFGMPWPEFIRDSENVRREMSDLPDEVFYAQQRAFQQALLDRSRFFQSDFFFERYESVARNNLADYFAYIEAKLAKAK